MVEPAFQPPPERPVTPQEGPEAPYVRPPQRGPEDLSDPAPAHDAPPAR